MLHAKDPSSTYCRRCGTELIWEHPKGSGATMSAAIFAAAASMSCKPIPQGLPIA